LAGATLPVTERDVGIGDLLVHLRERGTGPPLVVFHHSTGPLWGPFYDHLAESFAVVAPDMPGYGRSTRPVTARSPAHLAVLLNQLLELAGYDRIHLVGLGLGGWVAAELAAMDQRRLETLTLVGAAGIRPREGLIHDPMAESWTAYARQGFRDATRFVAVFGEEPVQDVLDLWDYSREMTARVTWKPWMWSLQLPDLLKGVRTRSLVVWGGADAIVPLDCGRQYAEVLQNANLEVAAEAGHLVDLEEPQWLARLIGDFVASA
jgi:pimeloyl-ACP methyl ester carboxylesterase